jgi:branched-chain amino acid aminotransferase
MNNSKFCYFNGELVPYDKISLHISDLLIQRGYGVFDFFRSRKGTIPWLGDYTDRLYRSLGLADIEISLGKNEFTSVVHNLLEKNSMPDGAFKVIISGGYSDNLESVTGPANVLILNLPWNSPPPEVYEKGVALISERFARPNPEAKTLYYFNSLRLRKKFKEYGAAEVMYFTDTVSEASRANLFFVKNGRISTPASGILHGITRKQVLKLSPEIIIEDIPSSRIYDFDEIFLTSTTRDVTPVVSVDGRKVGRGTRGQVTAEIRERLRKSLE